jgi:hypothetical protein
MTMEYHDHGNVTRLLNASAKSLEIFCFSPTLKGEPQIKIKEVSHNSSSDEANPTALNPIDLSHLPRLRIFRLRVGMAVPRLAGLSLRPRFHLWVHNVVSQLRNSANIEEISIKSSLRKELEEGLANFSMFAWEPVDEVLSTIPSLRRVTFFVGSDEIDLSPRILQKFDEGFPSLTSHGTLSVEAADSKF